MLEVVVVVGAVAVLYASYQRGRSVGYREAERLYLTHPPRCRHDGCLCVPGAFVDNPHCPFHGEQAGVSAS